MLESGILFNLSIYKIACIITSITTISKGCCITKFGSNWAYSRGLRELDYPCWLAIHIIPLYWLFVQIQTQMDFFTLCQTHQLRHVGLCINNFLSCQLHIFFNRHFFTSKIQRGIETCQLICWFFHSISHIHRPWQNQHSNLQVKSWTSSSYFIWFGDSSLSTLESTT